MIGQMIPGIRLRSMGWLALIGTCFALLVVLSFRVNALKSEVRLEEKRIIALKQEKLYLETEFETRASQQQLKAWNDVEFGYVAPGSTQYLENERQLASLGKLPGPDAPRPIRVASADDAVVAAAAFPQMVSPLTGQILEAVKPKGEKAEAPAKPVDRAKATATLSERLGKVEARTGVDKPARAQLMAQASDKAAKGKNAKPADKADKKAKADTKLAVKTVPAKADKLAKTKPADKPTRIAAKSTPAKSVPAKSVPAKSAPAKSTSVKPAPVKVAAKSAAKAKPQGGAGGTRKEARR